MKVCKRCFREFEEGEVDVVAVGPAKELADYLDSRFHGIPALAEMTKVSDFYFSQNHQ